MEEKIKEMAKVLPDMIIDKTWRPEKVARELYKIAVPEGCVMLRHRDLLDELEFNYDAGYKKGLNDALNEFLNLKRSSGLMISSGDLLDTINKIAAIYEVEVEDE